jgi:predicted metal-binding transcription factor (methanogenesis marker protein 9)
MEKIPKSLLRDLPNWPHAPVPICMGGDYRALTFCCKPGTELNFGYKCLRDKRLAEIGMNSDEFIELKEKFSEDQNWSGNICCFGSLSYCCMRQGGCSRRDIDLLRRYPGLTREQIMAEYFLLKRKLANIILQNAKYHEKVAPFLERD